jgi:DNA-binding beta-propeller fold protein YncE
MKWGSNGIENGQFAAPTFVAIDKVNNVYVSDTDNHRYQKFSRDGKFLLMVGELGKGEGNFTAPIGIATDPVKNDIYVIDNINGDIQKFNDNGKYINTFGNLYHPKGLATDSSGNIFAADGNWDIQKYTSNGEYVSKWGGGISTKNGEFGHNGPNGISIDPKSGMVYVVDSTNNRIEKFTSDGKFILTWGKNGSGNGEFVNPTGVTTDSSSGNVFVTDTDNNRIQEFSSDGKFITKWGMQGSEDGQFLGPKGVAFDQKLGRIYVVDTGNHRIQVFS